MLRQRLRGLAGKIFKVLRRHQLRTTFFYRTIMRYVLLVLKVLMTCLKLIPKVMLFWKKPWRLTKARNGMRRRNVPKRKQNNWTETEVDKYCAPMSSKFSVKSMRVRNSPKTKQSSAPHYFFFLNSIFWENKLFVQSIQRVIKSL